MNLSLLLAAATLTLPTLGYGWRPTIPDDIPETSAAIEVQIAVDPTGKAVSCIRSATYGDPKLAARLCKILGDGGYRPAKGSDGKPAWGVIRTILAMGTSKFFPSQWVSKPDLEVIVGTLPKSGKKPVDLEIIVQVEPEGKVIACQPKVAKKQLADLAARACTEAGAWTVPSPKAGQIGGYVTNLKVRFRLPDAVG